MKKCIVLVLIVAIGGCITQQSTEKPILEADDYEYVSHLLDIAWDDYTLFRKGLVSSEQNVIGQLPNATVYHIDLHISDGCLLLRGHEEICYTNLEAEPLHEIYFRLFPNIAGGTASVSAVRVDSQDVEPSYELENSALKVPVTLQPGEQIIIQMDFTVNVTQEMKERYGLFGYFDDILVLDEFYPVIPVYDDEKWNIEVPPSHGDVTYYDASFYLVRITAPVDLKIVTSGIEIGSIYEGQNQIVGIAAGPARDFYIAASKNYSVVSDIIGETKINSYALPGREDAAELALQIARDALISFSNRVGTYPYTEFDIVSTPMLANGMEYPGIVAISEKLYDPDAVVSGLPSHVMVESVIAHETAHQWFYNVVGNDQVDEPWLDEAVVQYLTGVYYSDVHGEPSAREYRSSWEQLWSQIDKEEIPIGLPSSAYTVNEYVPIVYGRGPLFITVLAQKMTQELFDSFLRDYYESYKWGLGTTDAFKTLAEYHCQCDLTALFDEWVQAT
jgi:hypothetical protein